MGHNEMRRARKTLIVIFSFAFVSAAIFKRRNSFYSIDEHPLDHPPTPTSWNPPHQDYRKLDETSKLLEHFFMHIPKTGGWSVFYGIENFSKKYYEKDRPRSCSIWTRPLYDRDKWCKFCFAHTKYTKLAHRTYTMVRNPRDHVLSQYFHCKESTDHKKRAHFMPKSLDEWLEAWVLAMVNETKAEVNKRFQCYDPRNLQSSFVFHSLEGGENQKYDGDEFTMTEMIKNRYDVIAPLEKIDTAICVIFIEFSGRVPEECVCATYKETPPVGIERHLEVDVQHGVRHHGSSYNITSEQEALIEKLTQEDKWLYSRTMELFEANLKDLEDEYGLKIC